jgi:DNA (cytosine-5)-methyltransferase 1
MKSKRVLSLFSGCGGMDLGLEGGFSVHTESVNSEFQKPWIEEVNGEWAKLKRTSFETVFANDIRPGAEKVWNRFFGKRGTPKNTFKLISIIDYLKEGYELPKNIDVVTGGFPCQDFSVSGKRRGFNSHKSHEGELLEKGHDSGLENRGMLYYWMREVIAKVTPKVFIAENVKGLVSMGDVKKIITEDFRSVGDGGYLVVEPRLLHSAHYGVPQSRERIIFIGLRIDALKPEALKALASSSQSCRYNPYPKISHANIPENLTTLKNAVTTGSVLRDLKEPNEELADLSQMAYSRARYYGNKVQGQTEIKLNYIGPTIRSEHHGNIEFRRLSAESGGLNFQELDQGLIQRRLTVRECARIQTFPDDFEFVIKEQNCRVSASEAYKLVGNAVPPLMAYSVAHRLQNIWEDLFKEDHFSDDTKSLCV